MIFIRIEADYFTCGIGVKDGIIKETAPILRWAKGKDAEWLFKYLKGRGILKKWEEV